MDDLQNKSENKAIVKRMARFFSKNGLQNEKKYMKINDARINFLRNPEDPLHGYYKQKLSQYLSQIQNNGAIVDDDADLARTQEVIEPPPGIIRNDIEWMARYVSQMGLVAERMMMQSKANYARSLTNTFLRINKTELIISMLLLLLTSRSLSNYRVILLIAIFFILDPLFCQIL